MMCLIGDVINCSLSNTSRREEPRTGLKTESCAILTFFYGLGMPVLMFLATPTQML